MIVDCHCHAGTGDGLRGPWDTEARIEPHLERARRAGLDRTCVFPVFNSFGPIRAISSASGLSTRWPIVGGSASWSGAPSSSMASED